MSWPRQFTSPSTSARSLNSSARSARLTMVVDLLKKGAQLGRQPNDGSYSIVSGPKPPPLRGDAES